MADDPTEELFGKPLLDTGESKKSRPGLLNRSRGKGRSAADVLRDPAAAKSTLDQRIKYLNLPAVGRSMAIESAEKKEPHRDTPKPKPVN